MAVVVKWVSALLWSGKDGSPGAGESRGEQLSLEGEGDWEGSKMA